MFRCCELEPRVVYVAERGHVVVCVSDPAAGLEIGPVCRLMLSLVFQLLLSLTLVFLQPQLQRSPHQYIYVYCVSCIYSAADKPCSIRLR